MSPRDFREYDCFGPLHWSPLWKNQKSNTTEKFKQIRSKFYFLLSGDSMERGTVWKVNRFGSLKNDKV